MSSTVLGVLAALVASSEWGVGAIFARLGMRHLSSSTTTFLSLGAGVVVMGVIVLALQQVPAFFELSLGIILLFAFLGFVQFVGGRFLNYHAIRLIGAGRATAIVGAVPLFAILLAVLLLGERLTPLLALGSLAVVTGIALIATEGQRGD